MTTLLMTRPQAEAARFVAQLPDHIRARVDVCYAPLIRIVPLDVQVSLIGVRALIFTSGHAVRLASDLIGARDLSVFCVGKATTQAAIDAGWAAKHSGATADELVEKLVKDHPDGPILHLSGVHTRGAISHRLTAAGISTTSQALYDQQQNPLSDLALSRLKGSIPVIAPFFSPRTARHFAGLIPSRAPLWLAAFSDAVANPLKSLTYRRLIICSRPNSVAMYTAIENLLNDAGRVESSPNAQ